MGQIDPDALARIEPLEAATVDHGSRIAALETKPPPDLVALIARIEALEARPTTPATPNTWLTVSQFRDRAEEGRAADVAGAVTRLSDAIAAITGQAMVRVDLEGGVWRTSRPWTLRGPENIRVIDGNVRALPGPDWEGGSTDSTGAPCRKGVIRMATDRCLFENVRVHGGGVAEGFEDAPRGEMGYKSKAHTFRRCSASDWVRYGFRYASEVGGGFNLQDSRSVKWENDGHPRKHDADLNTGYPLILDAGDGNLFRCTFWGGERQVMQFRKGTITAIGIHPFQPPAYYTRQISGPAGVPITMPHQVRSLDEVSYDPALLAVSRDDVWRLVFTPLADIPAETPAEVRYRRDPVNIELRGYGSTWIGAYLDGGTVRIVGHSPRFSATQMLPGGAELPSGRMPALYELVAEYRGQVFDLDGLDAPRHGSLDAKAVAYPNLDKPNRWPGHSAEELAAF